MENYSIGDDSTDARTVTVSNSCTSVTAGSSTDAVTFDPGALTYTGTLTGEGTVDDTLILATGADISGGTIVHIEALTLALGATVTMAVTHNQSFTGSVTAPGSGVSGEKSHSQVMVRSPLWPISTLMSWATILPMRAP